MKHFFFKTFLLLSVGSLCSESANILGLFPLPGKSHFVMFEALMKKLAEKGHNVDVATHFPMKNPPPRYNQISLVGTVPDMTNSVPLSVVKKLTHYEMVQFMTETITISSCKAAFNFSAIKDLKTTNTKYDLLITEIFGADCMLGFGHYFKIPVVSVTSSTSLPWANDRFGNPDNPSYISTYFSIPTRNIDFFGRIYNTIILVWSKILYNYYTSYETNKMTKDFFGPDVPTVEEMTYNTSLLFVNSHFSINYARPLVPNVIEVAGIHIQEPKPLLPEFEKLLTENIDHGIIYLTMGSMVMTETFDVDKLQGIFDAFAELPYKVLWKAKREKFPSSLTIPKNIHFESWMPQMEILCHPNVKLFVSHGGQMGSQEAIYCGVPRIGIPLFADQEANIVQSERMGTLIKVNYEDITKKTILDAAKRLLEDSSYKKNCERLSLEFKDRPLSALDTAVFWVEYVIRHRGAPKLRSSATDLAWYQYYLVDVVSVLIAITLFALYLLYGFMSFVLNILLFKNSKDKYV